MGSWWFCWWFSSLEYPSFPLSIGKILHLLQGPPEMLPSSLSLHRMGFSPTWASETLLICSAEQGTPCTCAHTVPLPGPHTCFFSWCRSTRTHKPRAYNCWLGSRLVSRIRTFYVIKENEPSQVCAVLSKPETFLQAHAKFNMNKAFLTCMNR